MMLIRLYITSFVRFIIWLDDDLLTTNFTTVFVTLINAIYWFSIIPYLWLALIQWSWKTNRSLRLLLWILSSSLTSFPYSKVSLEMCLWFYINVRSLFYNHPSLYLHTFCACTVHRKFSHPQIPKPIKTIDDRIINKIAMTNLWWYMNTMLCVRIGKSLNWQPNNNCTSFARKVTRKLITDVVLICKVTPDTLSWLCK